VVIGSLVERGAVVWIRPIQDTAQIAMQSSEIAMQSSGGRSARHPQKDRRYIVHDHALFEPTGEPGIDTFLLAGEVHGHEEHSVTASATALRHGIGMM
jgi:hypothetical protein